MHADTNARRIERSRLLLPRSGLRLWLHLSSFATLATVGMTVGYWLARASRLADLWIVPLYLVIANLAEYLIHRLYMHRPARPRALYVGHTLEHHRAFHHDSMEIDAWPELELVLMPWYTIALLFVGITPIVWVTAWALGRGPAGLLLIAGIFSFVFYELLHALYHFPLPVLGRLGLLRNRAFLFLSRHHRHHHRLERMRWVNFNISVPLSDVILGTLETEAAWQAAQERRMHAETPASPAPPSGERQDSAAYRNEAAGPFRARK